MPPALGAGRSMVFLLLPAWSLRKGPSPRGWGQDLAECCQDTDTESRSALGAWPRGQLAAGGLRGRPGEWLGL